jgi:hypothetical protein
MFAKNGQAGVAPREPLTCSSERILWSSKSHPHPSSPVLRGKICPKIKLKLFNQFYGVCIQQVFRWFLTVFSSKSKGGSNIWLSRCYVIDRTRQRRRHFSVSLLYFSKVGARHLSSPSTITRLAAANCQLARYSSSSF